MSKSELIIGAEKLEFTEDVQATMQVYDFRDLEIGNTFKSFSFKIPMSAANRKILNFPDLLSSVINIPSQAKLNVQGFELIRGQLQVLNTEESFIKALINGDDWVNEIAGKSIKDLDWQSSDNHILNKTNIVNSWSAGAGAFYRYPLINRGQIHSQENAADADLYTPDFIPMYNIGDILEKIFEDANYTVDTGHFFNTTEGAKLYILSRSVAKLASYIQGKAIFARTNDRTDNYTINSHPSETNDYVELTKSDGIRFDADIIDEAGAWANDAYTAPETGTYRFKAKVRVQSFHVIYSQYTNHYQEWTLQFQQNEVFIGQQVSGSGSSEFGTNSGTLYGELEIDSGWMHLKEGDEINLYGYFLSSAYNTGVTEDVELYILDSDECYIQTVFDDRCREHGQNKSIIPEEYLPDIDSVTFLKGIKELYNLVFWIDKMNRKVYCFTYDDFIGSVITDWSDRIDMSKKPTFDVIAAKYKETQFLKYKPDDEDRAYTDYVAASGSPFTKSITLDATSVESGRDELENSVFAPTVTGNMPQIGHTSGKIIRIFGSGELLSGKQYPETKADSWEPRILKWEGTEALTTGSFDFFENLSYLSSTNYTNFPKATTPDFADIYASYLTSRYKLINNSKVLKARVYLLPGEISKLITGGDANEGFRGLYKLRIYDQEGLFILTKIETNGLLAVCEFVQKV